MSLFKFAERLPAAASLTLCLMALAACAGGGGGGNSTGSGSGSGSGGSQNTSFTYMAPDAATVGSNATTNPPVAAVHSGTAFPLKETALAISTTSIQPDTAAENGGATLTVNTYNPSGASQFTLAIPGLGVNTSFSSTLLSQGSATVTTGNLTFAGAALNYTLLGAWDFNTTNTGNVAHAGAFITGYVTPSASMPHSGTGTYTGTGNVAGLVTQDTSSGLIVGSLTGNGSFSANFATGAVSGSLTGLTATNAVSNAVTPWNNVSLTATIASGSNNFSGSSIVSSLPASGTPFAVTIGATGHVNGGFYGPNADEIGAVWTLSDNPLGGNPTAVIGVVGAGTAADNGTSAGIFAVNSGVGSGGITIVNGGGSGGIIAGSGSGNITVLTGSHSITPAGH